MRSRTGLPDHERPALRPEVRVQFEAFGLFPNGASRVEPCRTFRGRQEHE